MATLRLQSTSTATIVIILTTSTIITTTATLLIQSLFPCHRCQVAPPKLSLLSIALSLSLFDSTNASVKYYISTRIMCQRLIRANNPYIFVSTQNFWILRYKSMSLSKLFRSQNFCVKNISSALSIMLCHPGHPILTTAAILFSTHVCSSQTQH